ncbi:DCC1-like thiol-disulfide oxidoreductase family protein [Flavobacterium ovatum]|uniref:DCC1-like thiol-disulfide oxidoreductase family protein n=1 Tax=Flavobacterium ovatum TaxID=1928857 RepID=UPI00344FF3D5
MKNYFNLKIDAIGLSVFRMFYSIVLFLEIKQLFTFKNIIYDKDPFVSIGELDVTFLFYFWFVTLFLLFLGLFTRFATILNYIFSVIIFSSASKFEYHVFYIYVGLNFLLMFIPIARVFSFDSLFQKLKYTSIGRRFTVDRKVLQINYFMPVFAAIGLVYFDSVFHKFSSKMWMDGLGVWLPSSLPMVTWNDTSILLNQQWLMLFLGYLVLVFETLFIFLFWFKRFRVPFLCLGLFFHIGILIAYPIPWFALTVIATYMLMVPVGFWSKIANRIKNKKPTYTFYYDAECPLCNKVVVIIKHFDVLATINCITVQGNYQNDVALQSYTEEDLLINIHGVTNSGKVSVGFWAYVQLLKKMKYSYPIGLFISLPVISILGQKAYRFIAGNRLTERCTVENCAIPVYHKPVGETDDLLIKGLNKLSITQFFWKVILVFLFFGQVLFIWQTSFVQNNFPKVNYANKIMVVPYNFSKGFLKRYIGLTAHDVFLDNHFVNYNHEIKISYLSKNGNIITLPLINNDGMPFGYTSGIIWRNLSFNVVTAKIEKAKIEKGILAYIKYFKKGFCLTNESIILYIKEIETPSNWEKDFLKKQIDKPWVEIGQAEFVKDSLVFSWNDEMTKILIKEKK